jgi:hypothetical protein
MTQKHNLDSAAAANAVVWADDVDDTVNRLTGLYLGRLTNVAGTNAISGRLPMSSGFTGISTGARFSFLPANNTTSAVTMQLQDTAGSNVGSSFALRTATGSAFTATNFLVAGTLYWFEYDGVDGYARLESAASAQINYQSFTASGTWTKPSGYASTARVLIQLWGAGGGGSTNTNGPGGGGGAYNERWLNLSDMASSETVTIGAGGAAGASGSVGGTTSVGSLLQAFGGGGGTSNTTGGGGGGQLSAGTGAGQGGAPSGGAVGTPGGNGNSGGGGAAGVNNGGDGIWGGGGGGGCGVSNQGASGGKSLYGGGGGAAAGGGTGGTSVHGGAGGASGVAGSAPGGGGGRNAAGARGEVRITVFP